MGDVAVRNYEERFLTGLLYHNRKPKKMDRGVSRRVMQLRLELKVDMDVDVFGWYQGLKQWRFHTPIARGSRATRTYQHAYGEWRMGASI